MTSIWGLANPQLRDLAVYEPGKPIEETAHELGIDPAEIPVLFRDWKLVSSRPATDVALQGPMRRASPFWHQLERL